MKRHLPLVIRTDTDRGRNVVSVGSFSGRQGRLVEHVALSKAEAVLAATALLNAAADLPDEAARSGRSDG